MTSSEGASENFRVVCRTAAYDVIFSNSKGGKCPLAPSAGAHEPAHCHSYIGIVYAHYLDTSKTEDPNICIEFAVPSRKFCVLAYTAAVQCAHKCLLQTHQLCMQRLYSSYGTQLLCLQCICANWTHSSCAF